MLKRFLKYITINRNIFYVYIENKTLYENMLIEFYQTTNSQKPLKHKAFCYNLSKNAKDIFIDDERLKQEMLDNPYQYKFLVDLEVYKDAQDKITTYRAFHYKDKMIKDN